MEMVRANASAPTQGGRFFSGSACDARPGSGHGRGSSGDGDAGAPGSGAVRRGLSGAEELGLAALARLIVLSPDWCAKPIVIGAAHHPGALFLKQMGVHGGWPSAIGPCGSWHEVCGA